MPSNTIPFNVMRFNRAPYDALRPTALSSLYGNLSSLNTRSKKPSLGESWTPNENVAGVIAETPDTTFMQDLMSQLYNSDANLMAQARKANIPLAEFTDMELGNIPPSEAFETLMSDQAAFQAKPFSKTVDTSAGVQSGLKNTMGVIKNNAMGNKLATAGLGALGAANIAGLVDDDKVAGQLLGALGGGVASHFLSKNPMLNVGITLGAGTLGSLFDKLRAKKEAERAAQEQYAQTYSRR